ncbi:MAG: phytoene desaturase family protein [Acidimicrobiales bacterium]
MEHLPAGRPAPSAPHPSASHPSTHDLSGRYDAVVVGAGHNGLTAAAYLARAGRSVLVVERSAVVGGAARSAVVFPDHDVRVSAYAYLVSLLPDQIIGELGLDVELRTRSVSSYTPVGDGGVLVDAADPERTARDLGVDAGAWEDLYGLTGSAADRLFPTLTEPLRSAADVRRMLGPEAWTTLVERPIGSTIEARFRSDTVRGIVATDALIGTFARTADPTGAANRCFLYHVIGRGSGRWDVPVGGMGRVSDELARAAVDAGAEIVVGTAVVGVDTDGRRATVRTRRGDGVPGSVEADLVFVAAAPAVADRLRGRRPGGPVPEGAQLKVNLLLKRLPALRDPTVAPERAFAGTVHINEGYAALDEAYDQAARGAMPTRPPCEVYCHSLTDPSILGPVSRAAGLHTLTLFGLHMPARLFRSDPDGARHLARDRTLASVNTVLAEPIEDCLAGPGTVEVLSPLDVEADLAMPAGHIFHRPLQWPFAESDPEVGRWGVETEDGNVFLCGAGARRGGGVSGIPGRNAVAAALGADHVG